MNLIDIPYDYDEARQLQQRWAQKVDIPCLSEIDTSDSTAREHYNTVMRIAQEQVDILEIFIDELYPQTCDPDYQAVFHSSDEERYRHNTDTFLTILASISLLDDSGYTL